MNPTTRSWTPPRTFLHRSVFCGPAKNHRARGLQRPPPDRKTRGKKGKKPPSGPAFRTARRVVEERPDSVAGGTPEAGKTRASGRTENRPGKQAQRPPKTTGSGGPATSKIPRHTPAPARQTVNPARAEDLVQDLQPTAGARRRREEGQVRAQTPGAPTRPAGEGKRGTSPPARGSPTSS